MPLRSVPTQRLPWLSKRRQKTGYLLPSKVGVTKDLTVPSSNFARPSPGPSEYMPAQTDPSGPRARASIPGPAPDLIPLSGYASDTPPCQCTRAVCPPSQNPPLPSANIASMGVIGIPSDFPRHFTPPSLTWQTGSVTLLSPRATQIEPSASSLALFVSGRRPSNSTREVTTPFLR